MAKEIKHGKEARTKAVAALEEIASIVGSTLGPGGRTVLLSKRNSADEISVSHTKDGFNVLNGLRYTDPVFDAVHKLCLQASANSVISAGDGTTSTIVMAAAFANALVNSGNNPQAAARKFRKEINKAIDAIKTESVNGDEAIYKVALTSSNGDEELTSFVMNAIQQSSAYGTVIVEKNPMSRDSYKIDKEFGYQGGTGYSYYLPFAQSIRPNLANNAEFTMKECFIIPYNGDLMMMSQVRPMLETLARKHAQWNLVVVCHQIAEDLAANLAYFNRQNPNAKVFVVRTTPSAELNGQVQQLNDIASYTGGRVMDGGSLAHLAEEDFGDCKSVRIGPHKTFLIGRSDRNWIIERAEQNEESAKLAPSQMDRDIINSRNASLTGGCVKLIIGGTLLSDLQERADRADDAIKASQACGRSGALPGCGASYMRAGELGEVSQEVLNALSSIHRIIMENFGETPMKQFKKSETCYITETSIKKVGNFIDYGVADSFETIKSVISNAFELGLLVTNLGGYSLEADLDQMEQAARAKEILRGV